MENVTGEKKEDQRSVRGVLVTAADKVLEVLQKQLCAEAALCVVGSDESIISPQISHSRFHADSLLAFRGLLLSTNKDCGPDTRHGHIYNYVGPSPYLVISGGHDYKLIYWGKKAGGAGGWTPC